MKDKLHLIVFFFLLIMLQSGCHSSSSALLTNKLEGKTMPGYPVKITNYDRAEHPVDFTYYHVPNKVIITHPGATELLLELGLEDHIQATVAPYGPPLPHLAEKYAKLNILKAVYSPSQEDLLMMEPDLIMGWPHHFDPTELGDVETWHKRGVGTFILPSSLTTLTPTLETTLYPFITDIGNIFGITEKTTLYIAAIQERVTHVQERVKKILNKKTVLILQNQGDGRFTLYDHSYLISHLVDLAGGNNLCVNPAFLMSAEKVLSYDPDVILFIPYQISLLEDLNDSVAKAQLEEIKELRSMRAIEQHQIIPLSFFTVNNGGIRTIDTLEKIAKELYPDST